MTSAEILPEIQSRLFQQTLDFICPTPMPQQLAFCYRGKQGPITLPIVRWKTPFFTIVYKSSLIIINHPQKFKGNPFHSWGRVRHIRFGRDMHIDKRNSILGGEGHKQICKSPYRGAIDFIENCKQCFDECWGQVIIFLQHLGPRVTTLQVCLGTGCWRKECEFLSHLISIIT